ncbi:alanine racemase [Myceligenerans pegani]|uniref:Alanine racemase n=1 Tax=Myceligenerans pegani TaxID=2776917 RepID=A0ABR9MUZ2_9MICO|nr:alanine racemase [Myceligenerans sp. TRM 65318]MBE1875190.1 alanine racemase [Myceligenerans sp. TRM 65318]MBE3017461.1 alanine racemase [Myceligenerans sp. TRM 65318]
MSSLTARLGAATAHLPAPVAVVDLDRFDANARDLLSRADGVPVRLASKSVRVRALVERALGAGFSGVMAYSPREARWLASQGLDDVLVGYPSVDRAALAELAADPAARRAVTLMIDSPLHLDLIADAVERARAAAGEQIPSLQVCLDVDASLRLAFAHLGVRRSPLRTPDDVGRLASRVARTRGVRLRGLMFYEAQVAGLPDSSPAVRLVKRLSVRDLDRRRPELLAAARDAVGHDLDLVNSGGTGSLETSAAGPGVTEATAGSGLYTPGLFDAYRAFRPRPAAFFGLDVVREPAPGWVTAFSGGYIASGPAANSRLPRVVTSGWQLTGSEGAGEVQTPLRARRRGRPGPEALRTGDRAWFRHAKAGELMERFDEVHLVRGGEIVETVPTYRGEGRNFG